MSDFEGYIHRFLTGAQNDIGIEGALVCLARVSRPSVKLRVDPAVKARVHGRANDSGGREAVIPVSVAMRREQRRGRHRERSCGRELKLKASWSMGDREVFGREEETTNGIRTGN